MNKRTRDSLLGLALHTNKDKEWGKGEGKEGRKEERKKNLLFLRLFFLVQEGVYKNMTRKFTNKVEKEQDAKRRSERSSFIKEG